jgi:NitT/TauT family transport system ATP-binding protein
VLVEGVGRWFGSASQRVVALEKVDLELAQGRFVTVIGPSGCGKSTLLKIVAGLIAPQAGRVTVFGRTPERARRDKLIGFVPQSPSLLPWRTVLDNVTLTLELNRQPDPRSMDPVALLRSFGLGDALALRPRQLSGGMQQRVAIARALVFGPSLLVMDEPFSALDEITRERQRHLLLDVWQANRTTVLFVSHSVPEAVALSDAVVVMSARPGTIRSVIPIDLPRPRTAEMEAAAEFHRLEQRVRSALGDGWHGPG